MKQYTNVRTEWRALAHMYVTEINEAKFIGSCVIWTVFPRPNDQPPDPRAEYHYMKRSAIT